MICGGVVVKHLGYVDGVRDGKGEFGCDIAMRERICTGHLLRMLIFTIAQEEDLELGRFEDGGAKESSRYLNHETDSHGDEMR